MSLLGTKPTNFLATTILACAAMLCCSAQAAPKYVKNKQVVSNASPAITTQIGRSDPDTVTCYVFNRSYENICVVYDVYPVWNFSNPTRGTVSEFIPGKTGRSIAWAFASQQASMQCKLVSATYIPWHALCP